jgi:hypothetical protein
MTNFMKKFIILLAILIATPVMASPTLWHYYTEKGQNLPSVSERAPIYNSVYDDEYRGTYEQNGLLLALLEGREQIKTPQFDLFSVFRRFGGKEMLGGNVPASAVNWTLATPLSSSATTIDVSNFKDLRGNAIATTSFPTKTYFVIEAENSNNTEIVMCLAANCDETNTQCTSCTRGLAFSGTSEASVTANQKAHPSGASVIMTNVGQFFNNFVDIDSAQTVAGIKTFSDSVVFDTIPTYSGAPIGATPGTSTIATVDYVNNVATSGAANADGVTKGIVELSLTSEWGDVVGGTGAALVPPTAIFNQTPGNNLGVVAENDGKLNQGWIDLTENFTFSGDITSSDETYLASTTFSQIPNSNGTPTNDNDLMTKGYYESNFPQRFIDANPWNARDGVTGNIGANASYWGTTTPGFVPDYFEAMFTVALSDEYWNYSSSASVDIETWYIKGSARQDKITWIKDIYSGTSNPNAYSDDSYDVMFPDQGDDLVYGEGTWASPGLTTLSVDDGTLTLSVATSSTELIFKFEYGYIADGGAIDIDLWDIKIFE